MEKKVDKEAIIKKVLEEHKIIRYRDYFRKAMSAAMDEYSSELIKENEELKAWKEYAMLVMSPVQEIGKVLNIGLGQSILDKVVPAITQLQSSNEELKKEIDKLERTISLMERRHIDPEAY